MSEKDNPTNNRISIQNETFEVLLESSKKQLEGLLKNPAVKEAFRLKKVLDNMKPEAIGDSKYPDRKSERGADVDTRKMRLRKQISSDRDTILLLCEVEKAISLSVLYKKLFPEDKKTNEKKYKLMYGDIVYLIGKGHLSKNAELVTFKTLEPVGK